MSMSLPTPPRTTHKDKENQPPTPLTPFKPGFRTPRIVWSQEDLHHAYTTQIRQLPSSSRAQEPSKSILKKPSIPLMPLVPPEQPAREVTPEPADPLHHPLYLNSPVCTLVASLQPEKDAKITLTDLIEAYSVLSARLKTKTHVMLDMCGPIPALEPLREHNTKLVEAFRRDIGRAFVNPQSSPPPSEESPWSTPSSIGSGKKRGYTEQEVKHARDLCSLSHAALRCFSNISVVPVLCSIFTDTQLGDILTDILAIPLAPSLPTPNARKTYQIAIWTLQVQRLPTPVLAPAADRITYALRRGIDGELGREGKKGAASDGLKAVATLASYQPAIFLPSFTEVLPSVLSSLTSQNLALRTQATLTILSLSHALAHLPAPSNTLLASFAQAISTYLVEQHELRKTTQAPSPLGKAVSACLNADAPAHSAQSPMWALSVIAAIIVSSGGDALTCPRTIKFILEHLQTAMAVKRTTVRATAGLVWRALVWACVQLDRSEEGQEKKDAGWKVVRQIVDGAIGISIVAALVGQEDIKEGRLSQALEIVNDMIKKGGKTCEEGVGVFERLLSGVGTSVEVQREKPWTDVRLLAEPLFDGTLLQTDCKGLVAHVKDGLNKSITIQDVMPLREDQVIQHWDVLFTIWKGAIERAPLGENGEVPSPLLSAWQALLLTQAQLTQGYEHLTSEPAFISHLTELLKSFLTDQSLEWSLDAGAPSWSPQPLKLGFVCNLWITARNVFATSTLAGAAEILLSDVLRNEYLLEQDEVQDAWATLCAELVLGGRPRLVRVLWEQLDGSDRGFNRNLWRVVSRRWVDQAGPWDSAIELLRAPFALPVERGPSLDDIELWVHLVDCSLLAASARKISPNIVLDAITHEINVGHKHEFLYAALPFLLSAVDVSAPERPPAQRFPSVLLTLTNDVLAASYPPTNTEEKLRLLTVLHHLMEVIRTTCKELLVEVLACVQDGVRVWIEDRRDVFTDEEYNREIVPCYEISLDALKATLPSCPTLHTLTPLLISAFNHIPQPALGPSAFKSFWAATYLPLANSEFDYPEDLKPVLRNMQDAMCMPEEVFAPGLSPQTQTQDLATIDLTSSIIPDSLEGKEQHGTTEFDYEFQSVPVPPVLLKSCSKSASHDKVSIQESNDSATSPPWIDKEAASEPLIHTSGSPKQTTLEDTSRPYVIASSLLSSGVLLGKEERQMKGPSSLIHAGNSASAVLPREAADNEDLDRHPVHLTAKRTLIVSPKSSTSRTPPLIKKECSDLDPNTAMILSSSQTTNSSQSSRPSGSSLGKRRKSRVLSHSGKKRRTAPAPGVEIISISDDEDSEQVALDLSIVVTRTKHRSPDAPPSKSVLQPTTSSRRQKRTFFEAVEIPRAEGLKIQRRTAWGGSPDPSPSKRKRTIIRTRSDSSVCMQNRDFESGTPVSPSKRRRVSELSFKRELIDDWGATPLQRLSDGGNDDTDVHETPLRASDSSIPSSRPGQISASHIISPLLRRSRSEAYDPPSDETYMSSSPLKQAVARRRLHRARTAPAVPTNTLGDAYDTPIRPAATRTPPDELRVLKHAHVVVTSGASRMELQDLLEASRMANGISFALSDEMTKKFNQSDAGPP